MEPESVKQLVKKICLALEEKKAIDIRVIDIGEISVLADYFVIASAKNPPQMAALQDAVDEIMFKNGANSRGIEGNKNSTWVLMDYEDIIVHLFLTEDRLFYNLERIWQDGVPVAVEDL